MTIKIPNGYKIYEHFPFQGLPKYPQIGVFGMQIYHLATLHPSQYSILRISATFGKTVHIYLGTY
jgi:hypothetical protein